MTKSVKQYKYFKSFDHKENFLTRKSINQLSILLLPLDVYVAINTLTKNIDLMIHFHKIRTHRESIFFFRNIIIILQNLNEYTTALFYASIFKLVEFKSLEACRINSFKKNYKHNSNILCLFLFHFKPT